MARPATRGAWRWLFAALAVVGTLAACARPLVPERAGSGAAPTTPPDPNHFYVFPNDGVAPLLQFIDGATRTLDVYIFELSNRAIEDRFVDAVRRGVTVRAVIEPNATGREDLARIVLDRLRAGGVQAKFAGKQVSKTHVKSLIADNGAAWIGSFNYISEWATTRDYAVVTTDRTTVNQLAATFEDDWNGRRPARNATIEPATNLIISPVNGRSAISALLAGATSSIQLEQETLDDPAILDLLVKQGKAGVRVDVLLENDPGNAAALSALRQVGAPIQVKMVKQPDLHAKLIIVDGQRMVIGSHNLTKDSLDTRREVSIVLQDPAWIRQAQAAFDSDKAETKPKAGAATLAKKGTNQKAAATLGPIAQATAALLPIFPEATATALLAEAIVADEQAADSAAQEAAQEAMADANAQEAAPPAPVPTAVPTALPTPAATAVPRAAATAASRGPTASGATAFQLAPQTTTSHGNENRSGGMSSDGSIISAFADDNWSAKLLHMLAAAMLAALVAYRPWRFFIPGASRPARETADTQVMIAVAGAVMVTIIGDSVARAFGLVGLGGLIRFRSLIRDTRDAGLMFLMIAIGMACGLGFLGLAITIAAFAFVGLTIFDVTDRERLTRISVKVDEPRLALQAIRASFPHARILEAPNTKTMAPGAGTVVMELNGEAQGADAAELLDLLRSRGVTGVRAVVLEDE